MPASFMHSIASLRVWSPLAVMTSRAGSRPMREPQESSSHDGSVKPCCFIQPSSMNLDM